MPFSFTFKLSVPGISNPFTSTTVRTSPFVAVPSPLSDASLLDRSHARRVPPPSGPSAPSWIPRKRTRSERQAVEEVVINTSTAHRDKRRRGFSGAIFNVFFNAAIYGGAVGLSAFRIWRGSGKNERPDQPNLPPPPPYQQGEWRPPREQDTPYESQDQQQYADQHFSTTQSTANGVMTDETLARRKLARNRQVNAGRRTTVAAQRRIQNQRRRAMREQQPTETAQPAPLFPPTQPEFDFGTETSEVDIQIDHMGNRVSYLIQEGKRALGTEVVVMSDANEDAVDDNTQDWQEEVNEEHRSLSSRRGSLGSRSSSRSRAQRTAGLGTSFGHRRGTSLGGSSAASVAAVAPPVPIPFPNGHDLYNGGMYTPPPMSSTEFSPMSVPATMARSFGVGMMAAGMGAMQMGSMGSMTPTAPMTPVAGFGRSSMEDENTWESPEMKELMEKAREKARAMRAGHRRG